VYCSLLQCVVAASAASSRYDTESAGLFHRSLSQVSFDIYTSLLTYIANFLILQSILAPPPMTCLMELNLSHNFLRAEGAIQLQSVLKYNSLLTSLDLSCNDFFCKGLPPIIEALRWDESS